MTDRPFETADRCDDDRLPVTATILRVRCTMEKIRRDEPLQNAAEPTAVEVQQFGELTGPHGAAVPPDESNGEALWRSDTEVLLHALGNGPKTVIDRPQQAHAGESVRDRVEGARHWLAAGSASRGGFIRGVRPACRAGENGGSGRAVRIVGGPIISVCCASVNGYCSSTFDRDTPDAPDEVPDTSQLGAWAVVRLRWQRAQDALVRYSIRFSPTEAQRTFGVTLLVGAGCGLLAVAFHAAIEAMDALLISRAQQSSAFVWLTLLCPMLGGLLAGIVLHAFPNARGSGIPQVKAAYAVRTERIRLRDGVAKFAITAVQVGSGASLGREGPTVHMCAALSSALGRLFALSPRSVRRLLPVGGAAGVAAAFNAPIAAVTFTVEEIVGKLDQTVLSGVVVAAALAAVIEHSILGSHPVLGLTHAPGMAQASAVPFYALLGLLAGVASLGFSRGLLELRRRFSSMQGLPGWAKPGLGGLFTGACALTGLLTVHSPGIAGGGYPELSQALNGALPLVTLLTLGALKLVATLFSYSSGGAGGIFAPVLFIGAMLGGAVGFVNQAAFGHTELGSFALVGMGALFAGVVRAPITSVLIVFEMTGGYGLVLPLMIANMTAYVVSRQFDPQSLYDALLEQDGVRLLHHPESTALLEHLRVEQAMSAHVKALGAALKVREALAKIEGRPYSTYPVVDDERRCLGLVSVARLRRVFAEGAEETPLCELVRLREYVYPDDPLIRAVVRMNALGTRHLPVVSRGQANLCGILTMGDMFRLQAQAANEQDTADSVKG